MAWNTKTIRPDKDGMRKIRIINQTIVSNQTAPVGSVHELPQHVAEMHVFAGNAEVVQDEPTNRAKGVTNSDSSAKKRKR